MEQNPVICNYVNLSSEYSINKLQNLFVRVRIV